MKDFLPVSVQLAQRDVQRCGLATKIKDYDLSQHGFGVLSICIDLVELLELQPLSQEEVKLILRHDIAETFTGDLPWCVKNLTAETSEKWSYIEQEVLQRKSILYPALEDYSDKAIKEILDEEKFKLFQIADMLDLLFYCCKEQQLGNSTEEISTIYRNARYFAFSRIQEFSKDFQYAPWQDRSLEIFVAYIKSSGFPSLKKLPELEILEA